MQGMHVPIRQWRVRHTTVPSEPAEKRAIAMLGSMVSKAAAKIRKL